MTVLLVSPFIDPQSVGEPRWCYDLAVALTQRTETILIAQTPRNRDFCIADLFPGVEVHEHAPWQMDYVPRRIHALAKPNYLRFYRAARATLARDIDPRRVRCAHHFGPLALRYPTPLQDAPFPYIMGPLGGSLPTPPAFRHERTGEPWYYVFRDFDRWRFRFDPLLRASYRNSACLVGVAPYVRDVLQPLALKGFDTRPEIAAKPPVADIDKVLAERALRPQLRFLIVSRLIFSKAIHYAVEAAARLPRDADWRIDILGDGPMRGVLSEMIRDHALADRVTLHGHVPRARVDDFYRQADVFLFPSLREPSGAVVFEAMSWGLPMIAADYGGPASHVRPSFGIKLPVGGRGSFVADLAEAMRSLMVAPERRAAMSAAALASARVDNSMAAMADYFVDLYEKIGAARGD